MSAQVYSDFGQTERRRKAFLNFLLHVGVMLTIIKVFIILFLLVGIGDILVIFKINQ